MARAATPWAVAVALSVALSVAVAAATTSCSRSSGPAATRSADSASPAVHAAAAATSASPPAVASAAAMAPGVAPPDAAPTRACLVAAEHDAREEKAAVDYAKRALVKAAASAPADALTEPVLPLMPERYTSCRADAAGAWAIVELEVEYVPGADDWREPWQRASRLGLARIDAEGKLTTAALKTFLRAFGDPLPPFARGEMNCCFSIYGGAPGISFSGDLDRDGVPEVAITAGWGNEGDGEDWSALFRATPGGLVTLAEGFDAVKDDTGDGLADLEYNEEFSGGSACGSGFNRRARGPTFIAHNRGDDTFSRDDDEARAYARRWCPKAPIAFDSTDAVVCARLWGTSPAAILSWIAAHVPDADCVSGEEGPGQTELQNAVKLTLPFTLADAGAKPSPSWHSG